VAIYSLTAKVISRGKGHSSVAAAAYRSRSSLEDERDGETHDYSRKAGELLFEGIYAPKDAPEWTRDRGQLWNHVEAFEKRRDAQLAREFVIALPHELTPEQNRYAVQDWVRENFTRKGLIADVAIHAPGKDGDERNVHAHVLVVMRKLDGSEFAAKKERTADNAERKAELEGWRASWERIGNRHLERYGFEPTLDRRTLLEQGIDRPPTLHMGKEAMALERQGIETDIGAINRAINDNARQHELAREFGDTGRELTHDLAHELGTAGRELARAAEHAVEAPIMVISRAANAVETVLTRLVEFVESVLEALPFVAGPRREISAEEYLASQEARESYIAEIRAERAKEAAYDRMAEDRQAGRHLAADDVRALPREELENIKAHGDDHMRQLIDNHLHRRRDWDRGRERER
jgi:ATP-dependent exoDNAse (exonuclease V) alpha subunit